MRIRYEQTTTDGLWTSDVFTVRDDREARQGVVAGHVYGSERRAVDADTGRTVYGLDAKGRETWDSSK
jgi:hypothetical protein